MQGKPCIFFYVSAMYRFKYPAKVTQRRYGISNRLAVKDIFPNSVIVLKIKIHKKISQRNARKYNSKRKNRIDQKKFANNWRP